ncbi:MAG TPA: hypothetical protein PK072_19175, partial [Quisquiliibacterium sp.]|nr:hypothetical protein [Quisquiliibacterium sp.]
LLWQGLWYLQNAVYRDPAVPVLIVTGLLLAPWVLRQGKYFALSLGVNAYQGKPYSEDELLGLVASLSAERQTAAAAS